MGFLIFVLVFAPFGITYISTEHGPDHTPDYGLAFGVELAWIVFLIMIVYTIALIQKARSRK
jgi:hypothetical protein